MGYLVFVTGLWAFSLSFIGVYIAGQVDSYFAILTRIVLAFLLFLPFLKPRSVPHRVKLGLMAIGAIQLGLMYVSYYQSFLLLSVPEILLFTIFTPIYITLLNDLLARRFSLLHLVTALIAVGGAALIRFEGLTENYWLGFMMVQACNLCFAIGQVAYRQLMAREQLDVPARTVFGWFYAGALVVAALAYLVLGDKSAPAPAPLQWGVLIWLGLMASGLGYFLWNEGARRVDAGTLAIMNNMLIPAGILVNVLIWNRDADLGRLALGGAVMVAALVLNELLDRRRRARSATAPA